MFILLRSFFRFAAFVEASSNFSLTPRILDWNWLMFLNCGNTRILASKRSNMMRIHQQLDGADTTDTHFKFGDILNAVRG
jgi:hypothetical protein